MRSATIFALSIGSVFAAPPFHASFDIADGHAWSPVSGRAVQDSSVTHNGHASLRLEGTGEHSGLVLSAPLTLTIGRQYLLSGWVRTDDLRAPDDERSPVVTGAELSMESMPFDVHSESVGATTPWKRVQLPFVATRTQDRIALRVADGGRFSGRVWFSDVTIDEGAPEHGWPSRAAVTTFGPAYRYPDGGWIYLHIEGAPYDRGYQHGHLMSKEIVSYMRRCAATIDAKSTDDGWELGRTTAGALFQHGFDKEILEEMRGIADGASDAGAKWNDRRLDLLDVVTLNTIVEFGELTDAMRETPSGLEGLGLHAPRYSRPPAHEDHCSAFAATGPATRDGRMVIAHETWWPLTLAEQTNVMLDIRPQSGHRVLMQSYPGGIESGTDWYQNDAGMVLTETTIAQTPFNPEGTPVAFRAREAIQYGGNIDEMVARLATRNNGLYTNEWLMGDAKTNEIAMFELGTYHTRLWRSSRGEWFGGTEGFYWGDNNAKDLDVRLESARDTRYGPMYLPYVPAVRDLAWQDLYRRYKGRIDEQFAFDALAMAPLVSSVAMDGKVATGAMADHLMVWAMFGKPNEREWVPSKRQLDEYAGNDGVYSSGYRMISAQPTPALAAAISANETERTAAAAANKSAGSTPERSGNDERLWKGSRPPAAAADVWLSAGAVAYYRDLDSRHPDQAIEARRAQFRAAIAGEANDTTRFELEESRGALLLDALRRRLGDEPFFALMNRFFPAEDVQPISSESFLTAAGAEARPLVNEWLSARAIPEQANGPRYVLSNLRPMGGALADAIIVYGTTTEAGANRYAAEQIQKRLLEWYESAIPIRRDFELTGQDLRQRNVIFVGRPETNSALASLTGAIGLVWDGGDFVVEGGHHASEREALALAASNPSNANRMVLLVAGNSALETVRLARDLALPRVQFAIYDSGKTTSSGFLP